MEAAERQREAARLISSLRWLALATADEGGAPSISYVPFAPVDGTFGIVVSRLAAHTANLIAGRPASVLLVDDVEPDDAFARSRFSIDVTPSLNGEAVWAALESRHGATVGVLRTLNDFQAVVLEPHRGRLVLGFAAAYNVAGAKIKELLR